MYFSSHPLRYRDKTLDSLVLGVPGNLIAAFDGDLEIGRNFSQEDMRKAAAVGIITTSTRKDLFGPENPLNKLIYVDDLAIRIVGVMESKQEASSRADIENSSFRVHPIGRAWMEQAK